VLKIERLPSIARIWFVVCALISASIVGCGAGNGPERGVVRGVVTTGGKPIPQGVIRFHPQAGGRPATGTLASDGTYSLTTIEPGDGAPVGAHRVTIEAKRVEGAEMPRSFDEEVKMVKEGRSSKGKGKLVWLVPPRYTRLESSNLTAQVESGENRIDFALPAK
jgi:hypothetical protein